MEMTEKEKDTRTLDFERETLLPAEKWSLTEVESVPRFDGKP